MSDLIKERVRVDSDFNRTIDPETVQLARRACARRVLRGLISIEDLKTVLDALGLR